MEPRIISILLSISYLVTSEAWVAAAYAAIAAKGLLGCSNCGTVKIIQKCLLY